MAKESSKFPWLWIAAAFLAGAILMLGIRFVSYNPEHTHYHANFAVYLNGKQERFNSPRYYQPVSACTQEDANNPKGRVHMHDKINNIIHVHADAVTWGQFFENIGWTLGATSLVNADGKVYTEGRQNKLQLILNGQDYTGMGGIANKLIESKDRLLINYGDDDLDKTMALYKKVPSTAAEYNSKPDPASCSGEHDTGLRGRLNHLF